MPGLVSEVARSFDAAGIDLAALGLAWARAMPAVTLVPAFGLRALPAPARGVFGVTLAVCIFPALAPVVASSQGAPWVVLALGEVLRGLPVALAAAIPLWAATMAGGVVDALRGSSDSVAVPVVEGKATPLGVPLSLLASAIFLTTGGPARVASVLAKGELATHPLVAAAHDLVGGITLAVAIGGPLLAAAVVLEVTAALVARAASPAQIHALLAPLRAIALLGVMGLVLDRIAVVMAEAIR